MLAFQVGDDRRHRDEVFGKPIALDWYRQQPDEVVQLLRNAGFSGAACRAARPGQDRS